MPLWNPERAAKRKRQLEAQSLTRQLEAAEERQAKLARAAKVSWLSAGFMNVSTLISALTSTTHLGLDLSFGAGALFSAVYISDLAADWETPRWVRWAVNLYAIAAAAILVWQLATTGRV